jgi:polar amino acid transport system substrate-binding protein
MHKWSCVAVLLLIWVAGKITAQQPSSSAVTLVTSGVFTTAQALRGKETYQGYCSSCHQDDLSGGVLFGDEQAPALIDTAFMAGRDMSNVLQAIRTSMPADTPGVLKDQSYLDVIAYILEQNSMPPGTEELTPTSPLSTIKFPLPPR